MDPLIKTEGWEERLADYVESRRAEPFKWGRHDCCAFVDGAVVAMTGRSMMAEHRPYSSAVSAAHVIAAAGGIGRIPEAHGLLKLESVALAKRGDIVAIIGDGGKPGRQLETAGICLGQYSFFAASPYGVEIRKTLDVKTAWEIK